MDTLLVCVALVALLAASKAGLFRRLWCWLEERDLDSQARAAEVAVKASSLHGATERAALAAEVDRLHVDLETARARLLLLDPEAARDRGIGRLRAVG